MYRSVYDFDATEKGALSLKNGEQLMFLQQHDAHWWKMQAEDGSVGLVPACYVVPDEKEMQDPAAKNVFLESVERAMEVIHSQAAMNAGQYSSEQRANLRKLLDHRKAILRESRSPSQLAADISPSASFNIDPMDNCTSFPKRAAPGPPATASPGSIPVQPHRPAPALPGSVSRKSSKRLAPGVPSQGTTSTTEIAVPARFASELIEHLRINTGISYDKSFAAAETVVSHIKDRIPSTAGVMDRLLQAIAEERGNAAQSDESLLITHDGQQIEAILQALTEHKDDAQQRSWALDMDEPAITQQLKDLLALLADANHSVSRAVIRQEDYEYLQSLVVYFQMEHRSSLRLLLLKVFNSLCGVDQGVISQLLCSVLPGELSRAMQTHQHDLQLQLSSCLTLTMIFSTAEPVPYWLYDQLDEDFVKYLVNRVETAPEGEDGDKIIDSFVRLLLAFNQHFNDPKSNIVMKVLAEQGIAKTVSEQIILLVNRGEDPVVLFDYPRSCLDSVRKALADIFSSPQTSGLFFTADMKVLIEIILRQLADLSSEDKVRTEYLSLLSLILTNSDYNSHRHMCSDLRICLKRISQEEAPESEHDKTIVQELLTTFPDYFS